MTQGNPRNKRFRGMIAVCLLQSPTLRKTSSNCEQLLPSAKELWKDSSVQLRSRDSKIQLYESLQNLGRQVWSEFQSQRSVRNCQVWTLQPSWGAVPNECPIDSQKLTKNKGNFEFMLTSFDLHVRACRLAPFACGLNRRH